MDTPSFSFRGFTSSTAPSPTLSVRKVIIYIILSFFHFFILLIHTSYFEGQKDLARTNAEENSPHSFSKDFNRQWCIVFILRIAELFKVDNKQCRGCFYTEKGKFGEGKKGGGGGGCIGR